MNEQALFIPAKEQFHALVYILWTLARSFLTPEVLESVNDFVTGGCRLADLTGETTGLGLLVITLSGKKVFIKSQWCSANNLQVVTSRD